jgi:hypothetical protein
MSLKKLVGVVSAAALGSVGVYGVGCSSSSTLLLPDAGMGRDSSVADTGSTTPDSSMGKDSSSQDSSPNPGDSGDAGSCQPTSTASFKPSTYTNALEYQGKCDAAATTAFIAACGASGTVKTCQMWVSANVGSDAGAGNGCGNCIIAPKNNGGAWVDPEGLVAPNYGACVQLLAANGATCAAAFANAAGCESVGCDACPGSEYAACATAADMGSCSTYAGAENAACAPLQSTLTMCQPGLVSGNPDDDLKLIIGLVCGESSDGGITDSGTTDTGTVQDSGEADTGKADTGTVQDSGEADTGRADTGTADTGTADTGTADTGTADTGTDGGTCSLVGTWEFFATPPNTVTVTWTSSTTYNWAVMNSVGLNTGGGVYTFSNGVLTLDNTSVTMMGDPNFFPCLNIMATYDLTFAPDCSSFTVIKVTDACPVRTLSGGTFVKQ